MVKHSINEFKDADDIFAAVYSEGFVSDREMRERLQAEFDKRGIPYRAFSTMILDCKLYKVKRVHLRQCKPAIWGYELDASCHW